MANTAVKSMCFFFFKEQSEPITKLKQFSFFLKNLSYLTRYEHGTGEVEAGGSWIWRQSKLPNEALFPIK